MQVWVNGRFAPEDQARISVFDYGFLYGDGVFETLRAYNGCIFRIDRHLDRLRESARRIGLPLPYSIKRTRSLLYKALFRNRLKDALLRITVSRGPGPWGTRGPARSRPTVVVLAGRFSGIPERAYSTGRSVMISSIRKQGEDCLDPRIKSLNFLANRLARIEAGRRGFDEAILLNRRGEVTEGSVSNLFLVRNGQMITPSPASGILLGVTREAVIESGRRLGLRVRERRVRPDEFKVARECFITGTSIEVMPVHHVGRTRIGNGKPGPVTGRIQKALGDLIQMECGEISRSKD